ncbi:trimeric intracellular cation channel family protein [Terasakiella sp. A23]|uniref:trimeric intracellular cation channel family protein n=1 Tax=Terasakiella sp. FCG-A23 TaxID=3080561 RepID=UPI0029553759|nr:trimeric intracellular cation channel family protein [Terasakiella sp. A23]MDV7340722.1 trimeric intracellular cation channel family protein [Terasakiella sp. A23]
MTMDAIYILGMMGTAVFALSGAMAAARQELDIFGFIIVALAPAIGGGTVRDLLLNADGVFWMKDLNYIYVCIAVAVVSFFQVHRLDGKRYQLLTWADAFGLALFTVAGTQAAVTYDLHPVTCVIMGMITGTFGGMIRDIICNEVPFLLQKEIYALAAIAGSCAYLLLIELGLDEQGAMTIGIATTFVVRGLAIALRWSLPQYRPKKSD